LEGVAARENFALMPQGTEIVMYFVLAPFLAVFLYGIILRFRWYFFGDLKGVIAKDPKSFLRGLLDFALAQRRIMRDRRAGLMHLAVSYGALALLVGTTLVFIDNDVMVPLRSKLLAGNIYLIYEVLLDSFGLLFTGGVAYALIRRVYTRPRRLHLKAEYTALLALLLFIGLTGYVLEGLRILLRRPAWGHYSPAGALLAALLTGASASGTAMLAVYRGLWWVHALAAFTGLAVLPYTSLVHIIAAPLNASLRGRKAEAPGSIETPFILSRLGSSETPTTVGISSVKDLRPSQRLQLDACTDCGRCDEVCPALISGTPLSPRMIVQKLRLRSWSGSEGDLLDTNLFSLDEVYACTCCSACEYACPVLINPMELVIELRRAYATRGMLTRRGIETLMSLSKAGNPFGLGRRERETLLRELEELGAKRVGEGGAKFLYWVGCMGVYDQRARGLVKHVISLLISAGLEVSVLVGDEVCCGEPARRLGEEGRFQDHAERVVKLVESSGVGEIVTHCPHCLDMLRRHYSDLGARLRVRSHVEVLGELAREGRITLQAAGRAVIHDSCILARMHGIVEEPRSILKRMGLVEPKRYGRETFCCGAGGASYWLDVRRKRRENLLRMEELLDSGAEVVVTECPFCLAMLEDAARVMGVTGKVQVRDISELLKPTGRT